MKKILTTVLVSMMALMIPSGIFADTAYNEVDSDSNVKLYANVDSTYTVKFPQEVDVTAKSTDIFVQAKGNISSDKKISVALASSANLEDQSQATKKRDSIALTVTNNTHDFAYSDLKADYDNTVAFTANVAHTNDIPAGSWSVNLPVTIALASA